MTEFGKHHHIYHEELRHVVWHTACKASRSDVLQGEANDFAKELFHPRRKEDADGFQPALSPRRGCSITSTCRRLSLCQSKLYYRKYCAWIDTESANCNILRVVAGTFNSPSGLEAGKADIKRFVCCAHGGEQRQ